MGSAFAAAAGRSKVWEDQNTSPCCVPSCSFNDITTLRHAKLIASSLNKMWILPLVGYIGLALGFGFLTLAIGLSLPSSGTWLADAYRLHSVRTILSLGTRGRAYGIRQEIPYAPHLRRDLDTGPSLSHRWLPVLAVSPQHRLTCGIPWQHATISNRQALRSPLYRILWYELLS